MTFPDRRLDRPLEPPQTPSENMQDVVPPSGRGQDPEHTTHQFVNEVSRPLTDDERKAADRDAPVGERVYAPASERVPRDPVPGHRDFVEHTDQATPERQAAGHWTTATPTIEEPTFTRVPRPSSTNSDTTPEADQGEDQQRWMSASPSIGGILPIGVGWVALSACGVGVWLWLRWRQERNKPINRIRRRARRTASQARQTAAGLRDRMPEVPDEATRPAMGLGTALLTLAVLIWQRSQSRSPDAHEMSRQMSREASKRGRRAAAEATKRGRDAAKSVSDMDWQKRLAQLKERWNPAQVELELELEKISRRH